MSDSSEALLDCDREAAAFAFVICHRLSENAVHSEGLKRQLRGRSPKALRAGEWNIHEHRGY
jgi:hypothetical protein